MAWVVRQRQSRPTSAPDRARAALHSKRMEQTGMGGLRQGKAMSAQSEQERDSKRLRTAVFRSLAQSCATPCELA